MDGVWCVGIVLEDEDGVLLCDATMAQHINCIVFSFLRGTVLLQSAVGAPEMITSPNRILTIKESFRHFVSIPETMNFDLLISN